MSLLLLLVTPAVVVDAGEQSSTNMILGFNIFSDDVDATYSGGSWTIPLSNLTDPRPGVKARSNGLDTGNTLFLLDLGIVRTFKALAVTHTNLTSSATYRIVQYSDAFSTETDNTGWLPIPGYPPEDPDGIGASIWHIYSVAMMTRYLKYEFSDASNGAGYIEIGRNIVSDYWQPPRNPDTGAGDELVPNTLRQDALGGTGYFTRHTPARLFSFGFNVFDESVAPDVRRIRRICNMNKQVIIIPAPDDADNFHERNFLGTLRAMPKLELMAAGLASASGFEVVETV